MNVSRRINRILELMEPGGVLADIGCDHGYMCIRAVEQGLFSRAVAADIKKGPLERAEKNILEAGMTDRIKTVLSDGFHSVDPGFDCAVICGMGGLLIRKILTEKSGAWKNCRQLILGPQSENEELRSWLLSGSGFGIFREDLVRDGGKTYVLIDARPKNQCEPEALKRSMTPFSLKYGEPSLQKDPELYRLHLRELSAKYRIAREKAEAGYSGRSHARVSVLSEEIDSIRRLLEQE